MNEDLAALEAFISNTDELKTLEEISRGFNIFEALGAARQELRHSDFLSFLLNPKANHGLGSVFLTRFLKSADEDFGAIIGDTDNVEIFREWRSIDLLILSDADRFVCAIENKIDTGEHSNQLQRYRETVTKAFPEHKKLFLYLTPDGDSPSDKDYRVVSYSTVRNIVDEIRVELRFAIQPEVFSALKQYSEIIGGHIVGDTKVAELCRQIYKKHRRAIDLIIEHRPGLRLELADFLKEIRAEAVNSHGIKPGGMSTKKYVTFYDDYLDSVQKKCLEKGWKNPTDVFCEFANWDGSVDLTIYLSQRGEDILRKTVWACVEENHHVFKNNHSKLLKGATAIYHRNVLARKDFEYPEFDRLTAKIRTAWTEFLDNDLPPIREKLSSISWPDPTENKS